MHHALFSTQRFSRAGRQFSYHRCSAWPWVWVHAIGFLRFIPKRGAGSSFFRLTDICLTEQVRCVTLRSDIGEIQETSSCKLPYRLNMPHQWVSLALPDIFRYINSNWDTATSLHICYNSLFPLLYNSTSFYQLIATDKSVHMFLLMFRSIFALLNTVWDWSCFP